MSKRVCVSVCECMFEFVLVCVCVIESNRFHWLFYCNVDIGIA